MDLFFSIASFAVGIAQLVLVFVRPPSRGRLVLVMMMIALLVAGGIAWWRRYETSQQTYRTTVRVNSTSAQIVDFLARGEQTVDGLYDGLQPADFPFVNDALALAMAHGVVRQHIVPLIAPDGHTIRTRSYFIATGGRIDGEQ
jgi:hypothetical protein